MQGHLEDQKSICLMGMSLWQMTEKCVEVVTKLGFLHSQGLVKLCQPHLTLALRWFLTICADDTCASVRHRSA